MEKAPLNIKDLDKIKKWLGSGAINIFGLPFSGKDTHGRTLTKLFDAELIGGGDILRHSELPPEIQKVNDAGILPPSDFYLQVVTPYLSKPEFAGRPLVLSSVGRWIGEEKDIIQATEAADHPIKAVVYLRLSEALVHQRWQASLSVGDRGERADDEESKLETRINEFNIKTLPVIDEYRKMGLLIEINSDAEKSEVLESILARLYVLASREE